MVHTYEEETFQPCGKSVLWSTCSATGAKRLCHVVFGGHFTNIKVGLLEKWLARKVDGIPASNTKYTFSWGLFWGKKKSWVKISGVFFKGWPNPVTSIQLLMLWSSAGALKQAGKEGERRREEETKPVNSPNAPNAYAMCMVLIAILASKPAHLLLRFSTDQCKTIFCNSQA